MVARGGIEPPTPGFSNRRSTAELPRQLENGAAALTRTGTLGFVDPRSLQLSYGGIVSGAP